MEFKYRAIRDVALTVYEENGQTASFDLDLFNAILTIEAPDENTADQIRFTITDINMWEKI
jgi:hypothetical protein